MKVAVYYNNKDVRVEERPAPKISDKEILVKVRASGICGTDVMEWYRLKKAPLVLGHEITGDIAEVGSKVKGFKKGDRVFVSHHVPCGTCRYCRAEHHTACNTLHTTNYDPGGFSEYIRIPQINIENGTYFLPDKMTYEEGTFIEPLACVYRAQKLAKIKSGCSMLVLGSGISGILHLKLAKASGVKKLFATDISKERLGFAKKTGAIPINADDDVVARLKQLNDNCLADCVIVCTGATNAFYQALDSVDNGGTIVFFAPPPPEIKISLPVANLWRREVTLMTSYGAAPFDLEAALRIIEHKKIEVTDMITDRIKLENIGEGFKKVAAAGKSLKVIINFS
ncbi:MAG: alcohol dehydrogenase [Actinobacteria bacterium]|nr:MAG: alcohol dehydrogenase [Actinomycetota bacterium]